MNAGSPHPGWPWRVFLTCWLVYSFFWTPYVVREHFPTLALVERGTLNVSGYLGWTDDIFPGPRGGAYINNNPGASLTAALPLLPLRPALAAVDAWNRSLPRPAQRPDDGELFWRTLREGRAYYFLLICFLTVALVMAPATAATAAYLCFRLDQFGVPPSAAALAALLYGLATPILFRTALLNHNMLAGDAGFVALLLLWDPQDRPLTKLRASLAGLLAGYALLCDYSGAVIVLVTGIYVCLRSMSAAKSERLPTLASYAAGLAPPLAALALYQAWAFGSLYRPSQHFMTPTAHTVQGYRGFDWPSPSLAWANFFDPRFGLFAYCPALLLAFLAPFLRVRYRIPKRETAILFTYFTLFVLFCAANQYSWLQPSTGFRYLVPVVPALALLALQAGQAFPPPVRWIVALASAAQSFLLAAAHENDIRQALPTLWQRRFALFWMIRLGEAGAPVTWLWTVAAYVFLVLALVLIWTVPVRNRAKLTATCQTSQS